MNTRRFEMVVNDTSENRDDKYIEVQACLKEIWEEHKKLKADTAPGLWQQYKEHIKRETDSSYKWVLFLVFQPVIFCLTIIGIIGAFSISTCAVNEAYKQVSDSYRSRNTVLTGYVLLKEVRPEKLPCTAVWNVFEGKNNDSAATKCFDDPFEAIKIMKELNHASGFHVSSRDSSVSLLREGNGGVGSTTPPIREPEQLNDK